MARELVVLVVLILAAIFLYQTFAVFRYLTYFGVALVAAATFYILFIKRYDEYERGIIFRLGKFNRVAGPGWSVVIPFFEKEFAKLDVRTHMVKLSVPMAFTKDDLKLAIDGIIYYNIANPDKAVLQIANYQTALDNLLVSETRNVIGNMDMRELFANLGKLNSLVLDAIRHQSWKWGLSVSSVQIQSVMPPDEIAIAMQQKEIESQQLQAQRFRAEAQKVMIEALGEAGSKLDEKAIMYFYLKTLEELGKSQSTKIVLPMQFFDMFKGVEKNIPQSLAKAGIANIGSGDIISKIKDSILGKSS